MAKKRQKNSEIKIAWSWISTGIFLLILIQVFFVSDQMGSNKISYSEFLSLVEAEKVSELTITDESITGKYKTSLPNGTDKFRTTAIKDDKLVERLREKKIDFKGERPSVMWSNLLSWILPLLLFYFLWTMVLRGLNKGPGGILSMTKSRAKIYAEKNIQITFADVAGVDEAKDELKEIISFLQHPKQYSRLGGRAPKGVLLVGPPGTGKTLMAKAVAGEAKVPFFSINGSEFVEMFVGLGAARVRDLFEQTRGAAPCILFIDEIDALGKARGYSYAGGGAHDEKEQTLNQLLAEMDGFDTSQGVIILAATNRPEVLDPALLRAGRFDKQILIGNPDRIGRIQILKVHTKKIKLEDHLSLENIASLTPGFSGADLANLVNEAAIIATRRNGDFVKESDFIAGIERLVAGLEHRKKVMNPEEKKRVAYHEMGHVTLGLALNTNEKIHKVSIIPRGIGSLGYTLQMPTEDRYLISYEDLCNRIAVLLGGRASELKSFSSVSTGASDDLGKATDIARAMITQYGMSSKLGLPRLESPRNPFLQGASGPETHSLYSERTAQEIDSEIKEILDSQLNRASNILNKNEVFLNAGALKLLERETLDEQEISDLWNSHGNKL